MTTTPALSEASAFVQSVLQLEPKIAVFDCDGTLWAGDSGESFFRWELQRGILPDDIAQAIKARHNSYLEGRVSEDEMCGEMVTIHQGMKESHLRELAKDFFKENFVCNIFSEMRELVQSLTAQGCDVWAVSSTNQWVVEEGMSYFGVAPAKVLAASVEIENGLATGRLVRVPSGEGKTLAIREVIKKDPDAVFGNSRWDEHMLATARYPFVINPFSDLEQKAAQLGWTVYWPTGTRRP